MNKEEFLSAIAQRLAGLPQADIDKSLDYYREMIEDRVEDGMSELEAVAAMGTAEEAAARILEETPLPKLVKARFQSRRSLSAGIIALLILGSPLWLPLGLTFVFLVLLFYLIIWLLVAVLYAVILSLALAGVSTVVSNVICILGGHPGVGAFTLGIGLVCAGAAILLFLGSKIAVQWALALGQAILRGTKRMFIRKGE